MNANKHTPKKKSVRPVMQLYHSPGECQSRIVSFAICDHLAIPMFLREVPSLFPDDELAMLILESNADIVDKMIHGLVAYISTLGFEMLVGHLRHPDNFVTFRGSSLLYMDECSVPSSMGAEKQIFTAFFRRPAPKTEAIINVPIPSLLSCIYQAHDRVVLARSCDWECCMCSEDLVGIKELKLIESTSPVGVDEPASFDWPLSVWDRRRVLKVRAQPVQGFGHRPPKQRVSPIQYKLIIIGVNQSGLLTFVHNMLMVSGFRIVTAEINTIRGGTYAQNTYVIETFSDSSEKLLRAHFQCVVPNRDMSGLSIADSSPPRLFKSPPTEPTLSPSGIWFKDTNSAFFGSLAPPNRNGFGRYWESRDKISLSSYTYEGDWVDDVQDGFGFELRDDGDCVSYSFGKFSAGGKLVDGTILYPFEPPMKSVRVVPHHKPSICVYKVLIHRTEFWIRQLPKSERPIPYLLWSRIRPECASRMRASWTAFAESPIPCSASMSACQVAALLEVCGLHKAAKIAFSKRIDGALLEAMTEAQSIEILNLKLESERNMVSQFLRTMAKAYNIDRHMRQPTSVLDALYNPSISGKVLPLDRMRVVDNLGEGAYGKVIYAEYQNPQGIQRTNSDKTCNMSRMASSSSLISRMIDSSKSPMSQPSLISALTVRRGGVMQTRTPRGGSMFANTYLALKEQIGTGAELEKSCELVREWATLNALPHENIVKLEGICADTNAPKFNKRYLATALIEASLPSLIYRDPYSQAPELTPLLTIQLAGDIASGLAHMHSLHILHGDIKSPNILVDLRASSRPIGRICDFGHSAIRVGPRPQRRMCTFGWAAPESLRDGETDLSSDVWSWAVVVWEMYVKEVPWKGCSHPQMLAAVGFCGLDPSGFLSQEIPIRVDAEKIISALCQKCFRFNPAKRPRMNRVLQTVDQLSRVSTKTAFSHMHSLLR